MKFFRLVLFAFVVSLSRNTAVVFAKSGPPNIVFILADDLGVSDLGCTGSTFYDTPNLDQLAREGMRFTQAYAACPVCSPTRAAYMTGKYPPRTGITDYIGGYRKEKLLPAPNQDHLALTEFTIAEALKAAGYVTAHVGKWHLGSEGFYPTDQGYDVNVGGCRAGHPPSYFSPYHIATLPDGPKGEYLNDRLATECEKFLEKNKDHPFFLSFCQYAVHTPLQAKPEMIQKYKEKLAKLPQPSDNDFRREGATRDRRVQNHTIYAAMVESMDDAVGRILKKLSALGLDKNTVIIFTSDNGGLSTMTQAPTSNAPFRAGKGWLYEGGIREAMIVKWPGVTKPKTLCDTPVITMDFYPTLLHVAGAPQRPEQHRDGVDITPLFTGGKIRERNFYWHYPHYGNQGGKPGGAIRSGDWKLIEWYESGRTELYNLKNDKEERHDLASAESTKVEQLESQLAAWRKDVNAIMPTPNPDWTGETQKRPKKAKTAVSQ